MNESLGPKDRREETAMFRGEVIGALTRQQLGRGELRAAFETLSQQRLLPPGAARTRCFSITTLERWYYAYKKRGLAGLLPRPRSDKGRAKSLTTQQRRLLADIRREYPTASASLILRTLILDGRLDKDSLSASTLRRFFVQERLDRRSLRDGASPRVRLRWQAERPNALWHGDVCHGPTLVAGDRRIHTRIHALMDDASRHVVALRVLEQEREEDMLEVFLSALHRFGNPDVLYLDNGSTYRGDILRTACARMDISLLHARPYDPQARGKMERFWRTLREGCLDFCAELTSLHDMNARILAFLDLQYHTAPHASLMGKSPEAVYATRAELPDTLDDDKLKEALTVRSRRRVRRDSTLSVDGIDYELSLGFLAGSIVTVGKTWADASPPWVEHAGKRYPLHLVDPTKNAKTRRAPRQPDAEAKTHTPFDPATALIDAAVGRASCAAGGAQ